MAEIYDPTKPIGQRWSVVGDSKIWRLYHSEAFLTCNAEIFISGSESTAEHRVQIYTPDYLHTSKPRRVIDRVSSLTVGYSDNFTVTFSNVTSVDRVVLHRLVGSTHGSHADQRQVLLVCSTTDNIATCATPPNNFIAPPGCLHAFCHVSRRAQCSRVHGAAAYPGFHDPYCQAQRCNSRVTQTLGPTYIKLAVVSWQALVAPS